MRGFNSITVSPDRTSVRVGGGVLAGTLQDVLHSHCLFTPTGQSKSVGYISWACGGGYGFYVGKYGFGVDQILGARVIVASGTIVDTDDDPELLWALRGAGAGSFGIVVELRVKVYPEPQILAGYLAYPLSEATAVLNSLELASEGEQPDAFSGDMIVVHPGMLEIPLSQPALVFLWCWTTEDGDMTAANLYLEKSTKFGTVLVNTVEKSGLFPIPSHLASHLPVTS
jgi:FAD/FMN-containing dehydrogenase